MSRLLLQACLALTVITAPAHAAAVLPADRTEINHIHVQVQWMAVANIDNYQLWMVEDNGSEDPFDGVPPAVDLLVAPDRPTVIVKHGLEFGRDYAWRARGIAGDPLPWGPTHRFSIVSPPDFLPDVEITAANPEAVEPGVTIFAILFQGQPAHVMAVDETGRLVFHLFAGHMSDVRLLDNGRVMFIVGGRARETYLTGRERWVSPITPPGLGVHHEAFPMPNGNVLAITRTVREVIRDGMPQPWMGDVLVEYDRATHDVVWEWDMFDYFSTEDFDELMMSAPRPNGRYDWTHANAVIYNPADHSVYTSIRHLSRVTRIDYDTRNIVYNVGFEMPSGDVDFGDNLFSFQHAVQMLPDGNMMLYDNGNRRDHEEHEETGVSKVVELAFTGDPPESAEIVWEWTIPEYMPVRGDADRLANGHTLVTAPAMATIFEVAPDGSEVWAARMIEGEVPLAPSALYRAERVPELIILNTCPQDLVEPSGVGFPELLVVLDAWGDVGSVADFVPPLGVGLEDVIQVLSLWGPCP